jgi:hypothetical protein
MTELAREAAREIYEAQCDVGRTFDNSLTEDQIVEVLDRHFPEYQELAAAWESIRLTGTYPPEFDLATCIESLRAQLESRTEQVAQVEDGYQEMRTLLDEVIEVVRDEASKKFGDTVRIIPDGWLARAERVPSRSSDKVVCTVCGRVDNLHKPDGMSDDGSHVFRSKAVVRAKRLSQKESHGRGSPANRRMCHACRTEWTANINKCPECGEPFNVW